MSKIVMNWARFALLALFLGCAPAPYYGGVLLPSGGHLAEGAREVLLDRLTTRLRQGGVTRIEVNAPHAPTYSAEIGSGAGSAPPDLKDVPTPALAALLIGLGKSARGAELDLLIPVSEEVRVPVTVLHEPDGTVSIRQGSPWSALEILDRSPMPTPDDMKARYGIAPSDVGEASWTSAYFAALDKALSLLSNDERALLARVPIVREHLPPTGLVEQEYRDHVMALYAQRGGEARIELYDRLFDEDDRLFCGSPDAPLPVSVWNIVHEVGHVIADAAPASAIRDVLTEADKYDGLESRLAEQRPGTRAGTFYVTRDEAKALDEKRGRIEFAVERAQRIGKGGPVLRAYRWARGTSKGPTPYGHTSLDEAFAEAFAMYRTDPTALQRVDPQAYKWFENAGHIQSLAD